MLSKCRGNSATVRSRYLCRKTSRESRVAPRHLASRSSRLKECYKFVNREACLPNDCPQGTAVQLFMIRNSCLGRWGLANQHNMTTALPVDLKTNLTEGFYTLSAGNYRQTAQAATSTNSTWSSGNGSPRSRNTSSCNEIASRTLLRASSRVLPWLMQPGRLGTSATMKPSSPGYSRTRRVMVTILTSFVLQAKSFVVRQC